METPSPGRQRILVIDDDPILLANVAEGLGQLLGYEVTIARDGVEGLERFFAVRPDCVVVDIRMPGINGYQFVRALRGDASTVQTPLVVLSALVQDREQLAGMLSGADLYLIKPVKLMDLVEAVERAIHLTDEERQRALRELTDL
jgi:CheY-like chemotaxis protein